MSAAKSHHDYNYITEFQIWRGNREFECQFFSMSQPPLDLIYVGTNTTNATSSHLELCYVGTITPNTKPLTRPVESSKHNEKDIHHCHNHHRDNLIIPMTTNTENPKSRGAIKGKIIGKAWNRTRNKHCHATLICISKVTIKGRYAISRRFIRKNDPIKLCKKLTEKLMMTGYKSNIIRIKLDKYPLHRRIYFPTFIE